MSTPAVDRAHGVRPSPADAARAFGVTFGGSLVFDAIAAGAIVATARAVTRGRRPSPLAFGGAAAGALYAACVRPWMESWGVERGAGPAHAVEIDARPEAVWPWLAQIGQDRGGFYSYEWLENLAGCRMRNADVIHPEWQRRDLGERVMLHWGYGLPVTRFERGRAIALEGWGSFELEPLPGDRTRLVARGERPRGAALAYYVLLVQLPHFVMERKMLLGIKQRVEAARLSSSSWSAATQTSSSSTSTGCWPTRALRSLAASTMRSPRAATRFATRRTCTATSGRRLNWRSPSSWPSR
jgi:hypothetical protein